MNQKEATALLEAARLSCYTSRIGMARREAMAEGSESPLWEEIQGLKRSFVQSARKGRTEEEARALVEALALKLENW